MTSNDRYGIFRRRPRGFTLIELLVVVAMIAIIMGAVTTSLNGARERARIQKATSDVKVMTQAILAFQAFNKDKLKTMEKAEATADSLDFLIGKGSAEGVAGTSGGGAQLPVLLMAQLQGNALRDPWGRPYLVTIREKNVSVKLNAAIGTMKSGYMMPNFYRLSEEERQ